MDRHKSPATINQLDEIFDHLAGHYEIEASQEHLDATLPFSIGELKRITDSVRGPRVEKPTGLYMTAPATVMELDDLLDALANHYEGFDGSTSIDKATQGDLSDVFDQLASFYALG